jgi:ABC-type glutathione transport system ATPase component
MQLIFQDPFSSLNPRITVGNAIAEPIEVHGIAKNKDEIREKVMKLLTTCWPNRAALRSLSTRVFRWTKTKDWHCKNLSSRARVYCL